MTRIEGSQPSIRPVRERPRQERPSPSPSQGDRLSLERTKGYARTGVAFVQRQWESARDYGMTAYGYASEGVRVLGESYRTGDWGLTYGKLVDPALDGSPLGPDDQFADQTSLGPILTNRLAVGESIALHIESGATLPLEAFGIPNAKLDTGGTVRLARAAKPGGQTELIATLELNGKAGAAYAAQAGANLTLQLGGRKVGLEGKIGAEAEAGLRGTLQYGFAFDPSSTEDMQLLGDLLKRSARMSAEQLIPALGPVLAGGGMAFDSALVQRLSPHLQSFTGEGGLYAQAFASASASLGIFQKQVQADSLKSKAKEVFEGISTDLRRVMAAGGASVASDFGYTENLRTGEQTVYSRVDRMAGVNGRLPLYNAFDQSIQGERTLGATFDREGTLKEVFILDEMSSDQFSKGLKGAMSDMIGRPIGEGFAAQLANASVVRIRYQLKPEHLAQLDLGDLMRDPKAFERVQVTTINRHTLEIQAAFSLELGAQLGLRAGIVGTHEEEQSAP